MALDGKAMGDSVASAVSGLSASQKANVQTIWETVCTAIVTYLKQNAVVTVQSGIAVSTTGTAAAQTGSTTSPGTGSIA